MGQSERAVVRTRRDIELNANARRNGATNGRPSAETGRPSQGGAYDNANSVADGAHGAGPRVELAAEDRDRLVASYIPLVHRLCRRFRDCGEAQEDLVQVGCIGLLKAAKKFDPDRGVSFITYAVPVIVGEVKNHLRDHGWAVKVPRKIQKQKLAVQRAVESLGHILGRSPTFSEIAEATEISEAEIYDTFEVGNYGRPLSLDSEYDGNGTKDISTVMDYIGAKDPQFEKLEDRIDLGQTFGSLTRREKAIIYMKFYVGLSQTEIAKQLGISQMHVSRLQRHALRLLKDALVK